MYMYVYMYIYTLNVIHIKYVYVYVYIYVYMYINISRYVYWCVYIYMYTYIFSPTGLLSSSHGDLRSMLDAPSGLAAMQLSHWTPSCRSDCHQLMGSSGE